MCPGEWSITLNVRHRAAALALAATVVLTAIKVGVAAVSGSVSVLSEALHSSLDLLSAMVAYFTIREAGKPADEDHPFGHGKIETLSSLFEALLLVATAGFIIFEGMQRLGKPQPIQYEGLAIATIFTSMVISYFVYRHNRGAAAETDSSALHVNSLHFLADVVASGGVLAGLIVLKYTHWNELDSLVAFAVAGYIAWISFQQVRKAMHELTDTALPASENAEIRGIVEGFQGKYEDFHDLRTRKGGPVRHIDFHLVSCKEMTVAESHDLCDEIEGRILEKFPRSSVTIHVEPCHHHEADPTCHLTCPIYLARKR